MPGLTLTYYEVLSVDRQAPAAQIKSSYRRLAKRYHPDLNPNNPQASRQFQQVQIAYEVLSDPERRRRYDRTLDPQPGLRQDRPRSHRNYDWRARSKPRARGPGRPVNRPHQPRAAYSQYSVNLSLPEFFRGARRRLTVGQTFGCGRCRGTGRLEAGGKCERCDGYGFVVSYHRAEIEVPPGLQPDMSIRLEINGGEPEHPLFDSPVIANICVTVRLQAHPDFEYRDRQLHTSATVPAALLEQGGEWTIPAPEGGTLNIKIPANTASGTILTLRKQGLRLGASSRRGLLYCTISSD